MFEKMKKKQIILMGIVIAPIFFIGRYWYNDWKYIGPAYALSVSSNGRYAISTTLGRKVIFWNIQKKIYKIIGRNANIYSAYFIKNTNDFMWQDLNNVVHIENIFGKKVKNFKLSYPTYGEVMSSNLKNYIASDQRWDLYEGYGSQQKMIKSAYDVNGFLGSGKLLNLSLSSNNKFLLTSGDGSGAFGKIPLSAGRSAKQAAKKGYEVGMVNASLLEGVVLWDIQTGQPIRKFPGNLAQTIATISPNGKYIVSGDVNSWNFVWNTQTGKRKFTMFINTFARYTKETINGKIKTHRERKGYPPLPKPLKKKLGDIPERVFSIKFIDQTHYIKVMTELVYAALYSVNSPIPLRYFYLGKTPFPSINNYSRDETVDSAPKAHILVTGQQTGNGIIVYRYNPKNKTLKKIWAPTIQVNIW